MRARVIIIVIITTITDITIPTHIIYIVDIITINVLDYHVIPMVPALGIIMVKGSTIGIAPPITGVVKNSIDIPQQAKSSVPVD